VLKVVSHASGMRSIRGPEVSRGSPEVGTRRAQSPIPYTRVLPPPHTNEQVLGQTSGSSPNLSMIGSTALWRAPSACARGVGDYPMSNHLTRRPRAALHPKKMFYLGSTAPAPLPSNTLITRGPPGLVLAVSLGPILPHL
jgi:hypothetical protein